MRERVLVLDDDPERLRIFSNVLSKPGVMFAFARTAKEAMSMLAKHRWDLVFLDHDLGLTPTANPGDGTQVAQFIVSERHRRGRFRKTKFYIHSINPAGNRRMTRLLRRAGLRVRSAPFVWERIR